MCDRSGVGSIHARAERSESLFGDRRSTVEDFRQIFNLRWGTCNITSWGATTVNSMDCREISIYFELRSQVLQDNCVYFMLKLPRTDFLSIDYSPTIIIGEIWLSRYISSNSIFNFYPSFYQETLRELGTIPYHLWRMDWKSTISGYQSVFGPFSIVFRCRDNHLPWYTQQWDIQGLYPSNDQRWECNINEPALNRLV